MNKLPFLIGTFIIALAMQSCSKTTCYECTQSLAGGVSNTISGCDGDDSITINITTATPPSTIKQRTFLNGVSAALYFETAAKNGYTCK